MFLAICCTRRSLVLKDFVGHTVASQTTRHGWLETTNSSRQRRGGAASTNKLTGAANINTTMVPPPVEGTNTTPGLANNTRRCGGGLIGKNAPSSYRLHHPPSSTDKRSHQLTKLWASQPSTPPRLLSYHEPITP